MVATGCKVHCGRLGAFRVLLQRHASRLVETCGAHSAVYPRAGTFVLGEAAWVLLLQVMRWWMNHFVLQERYFWADATYINPNQNAR